MKNRGRLVPILIGLGAVFVIGGLGAAVSGDKEPTAARPAATSPAAPATTQVAESTEAEAAAEKEAAEKEAAMTPSRANAVGSARDYLWLTAFSRSGLIDQLEFEGCSSEDATAAVDSLDVDYNEQATYGADQSGL